MGRTKEQALKWIMRKQAQAEQWQEQNHHLHHHKLNLMQEEQESSFNTPDLPYRTPGKSPPHLD